MQLALRTWFLEGKTPTTLFQHDTDLQEVRRTDPSSEAFTTYHKKLEARREDLEKQFHDAEKFARSFRGPVV